MKNLRILHLANDEKFIDHAIRAFENAAPGANDLYVYSARPLKLIKSEATLPSIFAVRSGSLAKSLSEYDLIIVHSLNPAWFNTILRMRKSTKLVWMGWGYDYYDIIYKSREQMLLAQTLTALTKSPEKNIIIQTIKTYLKKYILPNKKQRVIERMDFFSPVLPVEYDLVKNNFLGLSFPKNITWNYGNLEDDLIKGFEGAQVDGNSILVGNSASAENNHIDAFSLLKTITNKGRKIVSPLSYGNSRYGNLIVKNGNSIFGDDFIPLINFMPLAEYIRTINSCGFVVMNHIRQQAVGNIVIMLYLGAKVFLRQECPTYSYFRDQGITLYSTQELQEDPTLLNELLDATSMKNNREILKNHWSKQASHTRTKILLERVTNSIQD